MLIAPARARSEGTFYGTVHGNDRRPVAGAMVTLSLRRVQRATTVFTGADGSFTLPALATGLYDVRVRRAGYKDLEQRDIGLKDGVRAAELTLDVETNPDELAWQLPSSRWLPLLLAQLSSDAHREEFLRQCTFCHQQGSWATRVTRSAEDWEKIFKLMGRMGGVISGGLRAELPHAFNTAYKDEPAVRALTSPAFTPPPAPQGAAAGAVMTEWEVGHLASMQHDLAVHPDGRIYSVDTNQDFLYRLDPKTNERRSFPIPRGDSPLGGVFGGSALLAPNSNSHVAPHSLQIAPDGSIWITLCLGNKIGRFDPRSEQWQMIEQREGLYPHTLRFDRQGRIWYTLAISNHVGMIDPRTGEQTAIRLPARSWGQAVLLRLTPMFLWAAQYVDVTEQASSGEGVNLPVPYGIDIAPDGGVWFSQLNERRIGRIDPNTHAAELIDTPFPGPRRLRFDSQGHLWIPGFSAGLIARYSPQTREFKTWKLPIDGVETPYALNVDRRTDTVWVCGTNSDTLISFTPQSEEFTVYPLPTRVTYTREIDFDDEGGVWTSNSNFPTWQIENAIPKIIRIQPGAAARPAVALAD